jgi:excisionase family DNA binding protein
VVGGYDNLLSVRQVAEQLAVSTATIYRMAERGHLPHVRISNAIRVAPRELAAFIDRQRRGERS